MLEYDDSPGDLEAPIDVFVDGYNYRHYHERWRNLTPSNAYFDHAQLMCAYRQAIPVNGDVKVCRRGVPKKRKATLAGMVFVFGDALRTTPPMAA